VLIGCAQAIEHYEVVRYRLLKTWPGRLGLTEAETLLGKALEEEKNADALLTKVAIQGSNAFQSKAEPVSGKAKAAWRHYEKSAVATA
jgi:ferritin-like metal-binding protein YciE